MHFHVCVNSGFSFAGRIKGKLNYEHMINPKLVTKLHVAK